VQDIRNGAFDSLCATAGANEHVCELVNAVETNSAVDKPMHWIGTSLASSFTDATPPETGAVYFVAAELPNGRLTDPSNIVATPSDDAP
jgi:hypothetical protein